mmetsp:Transcript_63358/g.196257  ORF Transcript_63358/g.196257 Transcript_63358/m.196257 type:complete len:306 (+) Transcript_63358:108-1025(+)
MGGQLQDAGRRGRRAVAELVDVGRGGLPDRVGGCACGDRASQGAEGGMRVRAGAASPRGLGGAQGPGPGAAAGLRMPRLAGILGCLLCDARHADDRRARGAAPLGTRGGRGGRPGGHGPRRRPARARRLGGAPAEGRSGAPRAGALEVWHDSVVDHAQGRPHRHARGRGSGARHPRRWLHAYTWPLARLAALTKPGWPGWLQPRVASGYGGGGGPRATGAALGAGPRGVVSSPRVLLRAAGRHLKVDACGGRSDDLACLTEWSSHQVVLGALQRPPVCEVVEWWGNHLVGRFWSSWPRFAAFPRG